MIRPARPHNTPPSCERKRDNPITRLIYLSCVPCIAGSSHDRARRLKESKYKFFQRPFLRRNHEFLSSAIAIFFFRAVCANSVRLYSVREDERSSPPSGAWNLSRCMIQRDETPSGERRRRRRRQIQVQTCRTTRRNRKDRLALPLFPFRELLLFSFFSLPYVDIGLRRADERGREHSS